MVQQPQVLGRLRAVGHAGQDGGDGRMMQRKLQGRGLQRHAMPAADRLDAARALEDRGRGGGIVVTGALDRARGEDAGIVGSAEQDAGAAALAERQEAVERLLVEQRVAAGEQEAVEVARFEEGLAGLPFVEAAADRLDDALLAQPEDRRIGALHGLAEGLRIGVAMVAPVRVVDEQDVDPVGTEPLHAVLDRAHDAVAAVIGCFDEGGRGGEEARVERAAHRRLGHPADLGRDHRRLSREAPERAAEPPLRQADAVMRRVSK